MSPLLFSSNSYIEQDHMKSGPITPQLFYVFVESINTPVYIGSHLTKILTEYVRIKVKDVAIVFHADIDSAITGLVMLDGLSSDAMLGRQRGALKLLCGMVTAGFNTLADSASDPIDLIVRKSELLQREGTITVAIETNSLADLTPSSFHCILELSAVPE